MLVSGPKYDGNRHSGMPFQPKSRYAWKTRAYPVPTPSRSAFRLKASALRGLPRWMGGASVLYPVTIAVPALYNFLPAESVAMGWLNEIDALTTIRQRIICVAKLTGWDVFTFHTLHNLDHYFDSTISAVRETWVNEGSLSVEAVTETMRRFGRPNDYHRIQPRLIENLVFQSSILDWLSHRAAGVPLRFHVVGTALLSALVWCGALSFAAAVKTAAKIGARWDDSLDVMVEEEASQNSRKLDDLGWLRFEKVRKLVEGRGNLPLGVAREDLPEVSAPARSFWYSATAKEQPVLIQAAQDAAAALETLNVASWSATLPKTDDDSVRGWLASSLHPLARACHWSLSNYLLATPAAATLFLDYIATMGPPSILAVERQKMSSHALNGLNGFKSVKSV